ncbi:response regulator [Agrobacterium vitis]|uniref:response regulator n=1 Tax=Agrobacterium vitis TaxID=373 RepID=UPI0012E74EB0|nr:response regulator [Agrobacterium vitis]MVA38027.1 response regulator [Agrobacterium vitis]MVA82500.1 response regulator [Agrobacterium vitis]
MPSRILVVEDEWLIAEDYAAVLSNAGHTIVGPCPSVKAALAILDLHTVDAAFLDMELLDEKSFAIGERLKELSIPFTFLSGYEARELPNTLRGQLVLAKPVEHAVLLAAAKRMCATA